MFGPSARPRRRRLAFALAGALGALLVASPAALAGIVARDFTGVALNIIPSGQYGSVPPPPGADRQARMYDALTPLFDRVDTGDINRLFKSAKFGAAGSPAPTRVEPVPRAGVTLVRDAFNVPHITATTKDGAIFAAGWVLAEDRGLLLEQARFNARVAAVDAPNLGALQLITELRQFVPSAQTEAEVAKQTRVLQAAGPNGRLLLHDIDVFISGINAYLAANSPGTQPWTRNDVYAVNALKGQFLGEGGGREVRNAEFLSGLIRRLGARRGFSVFNDMRNRNDPEASHSVDGFFPYELRLPRSRAGNVIVDNGSYRPIEFLPAEASAAEAPDDPTASNVLMVNGRRAAGGNPIMVGGPQIGYFYPGLTLEMDVHAPGFSWRGITSAPFPGYLLIGRGPDFATTLTSAGGDIVDQYVETLCGGSDRKYLYRGRCRDMGTFDAGVIRGSGGRPDVRVRFNTTVHGPVVGYARVRGRRVAISRKRASYGRDVLDQLFFQDLSYTGRIRNARDFFRAAAKSPQTFNSFYMDDRDIGVYVSGRLPLRAPNVDPGLPTDGRGGYEWRGFLSDRAHPQGVNPANGTMINWNNPTARGFTASDEQWGHGPMQRNLLLTRVVARRARHTPASVTAAMNAAATQDTRAVLFVPTLARVLRRVDPPNARARRMLALLERWRARGGSRLDRDLDGRIDDPGAAILDTAWDGMANAAMRPWIGSQLDQLATLHGRFDLPPSGQFNGWHHYMSKDLRSLLGMRVRGPLRNRYCGRGNVERCARSLWAALDAAGRRLARRQGPDPARWRADARRERIRFVPGLLPYTMRYTNRPSGYQQITTITGHGPR